MMAPDDSHSKHDPDFAMHIDKTVTAEGRQLPLEVFLQDSLSEFAGESGGALADYIPELAKADPAHFGIAIATIDGHVHEAGDTRIPFTIQSVSKAFVFALALELAGPETVAAHIGVEPSGDPFNSIRLNNENRPFNPMVNAGAIACSGLIHKLKGDDAFETIRETLSRFAGRDLDVDEAVFNSEMESGDRNRAIAWLLRSNAVLGGDVDAALAVYFRQCSLRVTAVDLAVMGATLACGGRNPLTGVQVVGPAAVARALSVMVSAGMYDYSGEWIYRVGLPAKSGVGGGIVAALPAQLGMGTFSPLLDDRGNSVRGVKMCERLSAHFGLHLMQRTGDVQNSIAADYHVGRFKSSRDRHHEETAILERYGEEARILELSGALNFAACDYICRQIRQAAEPEILIFGLRRVTDFSRAAARLLGDQIAMLQRRGTRIVVVGSDDDSAPVQSIRRELGTEQASALLHFANLDEAINWAEDQVIFLYGGFSHIGTVIPLSEQPLLRGMSAEDLSLIESSCDALTFRGGETIVQEGDAGDSIYFLTSGVVSIRISSGLRVASLDAGTCFGELALLTPGSKRIADVLADVACTCLRLPLDRYEALRQSDPRITETMLRNLAALLAERLRQTNMKLNAINSA